MNIFDIHENHQQEQDELKILDELERAANCNQNSYDDEKMYTAPDENSVSDNPEMYLCRTESDDKTLLPEFSNRALVHAMSATTEFGSRRYHYRKFYGIAIDTCCAHASVGGIQQYHAYCKHTGQTPEKTKSKSTAIIFGDSQTQTIGYATINMPVGSIWHSFKILLVHADVLILMSLADMDLLKISYNNLSDVATHSLSG